MQDGHLNKANCLLLLLLLFLLLLKLIRIATGLAWGGYNEQK